MDGMKHRSASCKLSPSILGEEITEITHLKAKKPGRGDGAALVRKVQRLGKPLAVTCEHGLIWYYVKLGFEIIQLGNPTIMVWLVKKASTA